MCGVVSRYIHSGNNHAIGVRAWKDETSMNNNMTVAEDWLVH